MSKYLIDENINSEKTIDEEFEETIDKYFSDDTAADDYIISLLDKEFTVNLFK